MALRFYNTLTQQVEPFAPLHDNVVRMYTCGPTVYNYVHIGNLRTFTFQDILRRWLRARGYQLDHVMNITDVEDKIIRARRRRASDHLRIHRNLHAGVSRRHRHAAPGAPERIVKATEHIRRNGGRQFRSSKQRGYTYMQRRLGLLPHREFPEYGKLSHNDFSGIRAGARVDVDEYDKADARDFVLWKAQKDGEPAWDTPIGDGRPAGTSNAP